MNCYLHYDVFTNEHFSGNQLAVFPDGTGLDAATMQRIANEMNFSESTFLPSTTTPMSACGSSPPLLNFPWQGDRLAFAWMVQPVPEFGYHP